MTIYQVSKRMFFVCNGVDYAAAVDTFDDVKLFRSYKKAEREFNELVNSYSAVCREEPRVIRLDSSYIVKELKKGDKRYIIELLKKETC